MSLNSPTGPGATTQAATRELLLEAAGAVFAARGYRAATVREICQRAGANVAAIHYHFGDKETLYTEVLHRAYRQAQSRYPLDLGVKAGAPAEARLRAFVRSLLLRSLDTSEFAWHGRVISREMIDPTHALDSLVQEDIRPLAERLTGIVSELLHGDPEDPLVRRCGYSIVGQCLVFDQYRPVIRRLFHDEEAGPEAIEPLAEHITAFSLAAMARLAKQRRATVAKRAPPPKRKPKPPKSK